MKRERKVNGGLGLGLGFQDDCNDVNGSFRIASSSASSSTPLKHTSSPVAVGIVGTGGGVGGLSYIEHPVSKFDTLAGVAIKYGVEVADIKRLNGLVSDLQMFALKTLHIPLPGRHPPSPILSNGVDDQRPSSSEKAPSNRRNSDIFDSFQSLKLKPSPQKNVVSPAMTNLQGFYGLKPVDRKPVSEGFEMGVYRKGGAPHNLEEGPFVSALSTPPRLHRKSRSVANDLMSENGDLTGNGSAEDANSSDKRMEKLLLRRRQKSEADFSSHTPEMLLKEESTNGGGFSSITGKGLALRPKSASRMADSEMDSLNPVPVGLGDSFITENINGVKKSPSTSSLQDSDNMTLASLWPLNLKPDLQAFANASSITKPIFDGLQKPISGRKTKTALD